MAQVDYFLKINGVDGESTDAKHAKWIEIESFSWGVTQSGTFSGGTGSTAGKASFQDFHFVMPVNKSSVPIFASAAAGKHISEVVLEAVKSGDKQGTFIKLTLSDVLVSGYQTGGTDGAETPFDQVSLNFAKIEVEYAAQKPDGTMESPIKGGYDLAANKTV